MTMGTYGPLVGREPDTRERDVRDEEVAGFLQRVSDLAFRAGPRGIELRRVDIGSRTFEFCDTAAEGDGEVLSEGQAVPANDAERAEWHWVPEADSPGWAHLARLVQDLAFLSSFREYGPEGGPQLEGLRIPGREYADVLVAHRGGRWRVRIELEGREEPLEFPGMAIGELFGEGKHRELVTQNEPDLVVNLV
ncbi:hypothetical protein AB0D04_04550 [Streptomyces sp. NPDC048483]|uniref:hypothetical protein n=1 Tax=Streptomyces sp. NPDC048483 TaxID=3154927 RepID=UPI003421A5F4